MIALVLDAELKSALAAIRALGRAGITVVCGSGQKAAMGSYSRYCSRRFVYRSALSSQRGFIEDVLAACPGNELVVPLSFSDATFLALARNTELVKEKIHFALPPVASVECAFSKRKTWMLAQQLGIPTPKTYSPASLQELRDTAPAQAYPVVVKPEHTAAWVGERGSAGHVSFAHTPEELLRIAEKVYLETREMPLVQSLVRGEEFGVEALVDNGVIRALCAHRRIRSLSPTGGASVLKETVAAPESMRTYAQAMLSALKWHGVAMVEFKMDGKTQTPVLLEINGRFWGSLPLALHAGINFPLLYVKLLTGTLEPSEAAEVCAVGVRSRHLLGDVRHLLRVLLGHDRMRPMTYPTRLQACKDFLLTGGSRADVFDIRDPVPSAMEVISHMVK